MKTGRAALPILLLAAFLASFASCGRPPRADDLVVTFYYLPG